MFGNGSMALVNAETLLPSASWWELRQHYSGVWHKWRTKRMVFCDGLNIGVAGK